MNAESVPCPVCGRPLPSHVCNTAAPIACPSCSRRLLVTVFPALFRPAFSGGPGETALEEGVSRCFYHEQKKAVIACDGCGRFLCALCDVEFKDQHLCPSCLQSGQSKGQFAMLDNQRILWD